MPYVTCSRCSTRSYAAPGGEVARCPVCDAPLRAPVPDRGAAGERTEDAELADRHRAGDPHAFGLLHARYAPRLHPFAVRLLGARRHDADDVIQETFERAHRYLMHDPRARAGDLGLGPWLHTVVRHCCIDELRRRPREDLDAAAALVCGGPTPHDRVVVAEALREVTHRVRSLPARQREAFVLHALDGLPHDDVARRLSVSVGATKSLVNRARVELRHEQAA